MKRGFISRFHPPLQRAKLSEKEKRKEETWARERAADLQFEVLQLCSFGVFSTMLPSSDGSLLWDENCDIFYNWFYARSMHCIVIDDATFLIPCLILFFSCLIFSHLNPFRCGSSGCWRLVSSSVVSLRVSFFNSSLELVSLWAC